MPRTQDEAFLSELEALPSASGRPSSKKPQEEKRIRVSKNMVSLRYRAAQLWKNAGIELLLILLLFFSLRHILYTGSTGEEARRIAAESLQLARGELSAAVAAPLLSSRQPAGKGDTAARPPAASVLLPLGLISLVTGGGKTVIDLVTIALALLAIAGIYAAGKALFSSETGIAAAALITLLPAFITRAAGLYALTFGYAYSAAAIWLLARSRKSGGAPGLLGAGVAISFAIHAEILFLYLLVFFVLFCIEGGTPLRAAGLTLGGFVLSEIVLALLFLLTTGAAPLGHIAALFGGASAIAADGYASLADLFEQLFTNPQLIPFSLLALLAIGYTLRASKSSFPYQPLLLFAAAYFTLELFPVSFTPFATLPISENMAAVMAPAFALLLGTFFAGLANRMALRWFLAAMNILALPLLFFY